MVHEIKNQVKAKLLITIATLKKNVKVKFHYTTSYKKIWHAKQKAITKIFGDWDTSYQELPKFMATLQKYNKTTIT